VPQQDVSWNPTLGGPVTPQSCPQPAAPISAAQNSQTAQSARIDVIEGPSIVRRSAEGSAVKLRMRSTFCRVTPGLVAWQPGARYRQHQRVPGVRRRGKHGLGDLTCSSAQRSPFSGERPSAANRQLQRFVSPYSLSLLAASKLSAVGSGGESRRPPPVHRREGRSTRIRETTEQCTPRTSNVRKLAGHFADATQCRPKLVDESVGDCKIPLGIPRLRLRYVRLGLRADGETGHRRRFKSSASTSSHGRPRSGCAA
jgi:hypothetical protein